MNTDLTLDSLNIEVTKAETSRDAFTDDIDVAMERLLTTDEAETLLNEHVEAKQTQKVDNTSYDLPDQVTSYLKIETTDLLKVVSQLNTIIYLNAQRAVSRGLSFRVLSNNTIELINPNDMTYFKADLDAETNLEVGTTIFVDYQFIQKMLRFLPPKILIYLKDSVYYIRLVTGDLELINTNLLSSDLNKLNLEYKILTDKLVTTLPSDSTYRKLSTLARLLNFESDSQRRGIGSFNNLTTFRSSLVYASTKTELPDIKVNQKITNYLIKAAQLSKGSEIKVYATDSESLIRYAIVVGNTTMVTNYANSTEDARIQGMLDNIPKLTVIDYSNLKYKLDFASSITYAIGRVTFEYDGTDLTAKIKLQNGSESTIVIPTFGDITIPMNTPINTITKTLLTALNALDPTMETRLGYKDGILYLTNDDITIGLINI